MSIFGTFSDADDFDLPHVNNLNHPEALNHLMRKDFWKQIVAYEEKHNLTDIKTKKGEHGAERLDLILKERGIKDPHPFIGREVTIKFFEKTVNKKGEKSLRFPIFKGIGRSEIEGNVKEGIILRYKRVSNYNEMDSKEAFIVEKINKGASTEEVILSLMENFQIKNIDKARIFLADFISRQQIVQAAFKSKKTRIKNNPGFLTTIVTERYEPNIVVSITGINSSGKFTT